MGCDLQKSRAYSFGVNRGSVLVRPVLPADADAWLGMRRDLWRDENDAHRADIDRYFAAPSARHGAVLVAERDGALEGFVELSLRAYAEGCDTSPVAYLEGWYVSPDARGSGVGRALLRAAEAWGQSQGCTELASDTQAANEASAAVHRACGFDDVSLIRCFRKSLE